MHKNIAGVLVAIAAAGFVVTLAVFAADYGRAPQIVPTHFGADGTANAWGSKATFAIFPAIGLFMLLVAAGIGLFGLPSSRSPVPPVLPVLVCAVFAETSWMMALTEMSSFQVALGAAATFNNGSVIAGLVAVLATSAALVVIALTAARRG